MRISETITVMEPILETVAASVALPSSAGGEDFQTSAGEDFQSSAGEDFETE